MKTRSILVTLGAIAIVALTLNANASGMLSPRAAGNQIIHVSGANNDPNLVALGVTSGEYVAFTSPRAAGNNMMKSDSADARVNPVTLCARNMTSSPKGIQNCAMNPANMPCCK